MNDNYIFINNAINDAVILYCQDKELEKEVSQNSFMVCVVKMLAIIYDEDTIIDCYYNEDFDGFKNLLLKYGYTEEEYNKFLDNFEKFYEFDLAQRERKIKQKNKYFNLIQKSLVDMLVCKNNSVVVKINERKKFYDLLFTVNNKDFFKKSYALMMAYDPYEIDNYFKKQGLLVG